MIERESRERKSPPLGRSMRFLAWGFVVATILSLAILLIRLIAEQPIGRVGSTILVVPEVAARFSAVCLIGLVVSQFLLNWSQGVRPIERSIMRIVSTVAVIVLLLVWAFAIYSGRRIIWW